MLKNLTESKKMKPAYIVIDNQEWIYEPVMPRADQAITVEGVRIMWRHGNPTAISTAVTGVLTSGWVMGIGAILLSEGGTNAEGQVAAYRRAR